jgi:hypothetical protein
MNTEPRPITFRVVTAMASEILKLNPLVDATELLECVKDRIVAQNYAYPTDPAMLHKALDAVERGHPERTSRPTATHPISEVERRWLEAPAAPARVINRTFEHIRAWPAQEAAAAAIARQRPMRATRGETDTLEQIRRWREAQGRSASEG